MDEKRDVEGRIYTIENRVAIAITEMRNRNFFFTEVLVPLSETRDVVAFDLYFDIILDSDL